MKKTTALLIIVSLGLAFSPAAQAWINFIDFNDTLYPDAPQHTPPPPNDPQVWIECNESAGCPAPEGGAVFEPLGGGNFALRMDSPDHSAEVPEPGPGVYQNEYYLVDIPGYEKVGGSRFRLHSFSPLGKENLLAISTSVAAPSITLVDGHYWLWSYLSSPEQRPILDLGAAVADEWHEVYMMATIEGTDPDTGEPNAGGAKVWWDGDIVFDGPVDGGGSVFQGGYMEFGSGCWHQTSAATVVDFDWVGFGDINDFPVPPGITGDYNDDDKVDAADYVVWRKNVDTTNTLPNDPIGGTIGSGQYENWQANFGMMAGAGQIGAVPEPATSILLFVTALCRITWRRHRPAAV